MGIEQTPQIPEFISKELFEKALRNGLQNNDIAVTDLSVQMGTSSGDNYCSEIYRAAVTYTKSGIRNNKISLIVKSMPFLEHRGPILDDLEVFDKEVKMYTETLPRMSRLINNEFLCAKCFYATRDPVQLIVFEDLKSLDFTMADRCNGLDEAHCKLVLKKLAKIHAASYALDKQDSNAMSSYSFGMFKPNATCVDLLKAIFESGLGTLATVVATWPGYEHLVKKIKKVNENYIDKIQKMTVKANADCGYKVLNHGDSWVNNFLFKYEEGKPVDVVFVDYQMSYFSSPGIDLNYFLNTSPNNCVRINKRETIIESYYDIFALTLSDLNVKDIPTIGMLRKEINRGEYYGFLAAVGILPIVVLDKESSGDSSLETMGDADASARLRQAMYFNQIYQTAMKDILSRVDEHHVLDDLNEIKI